MAELPKKARVVIIGGGVIGCSIAYHLTKIGWDDVVLLERKQLTSGTTWHAAGLVGQLRPSINMTKLAKYTGELYRGLEAETGQATGYRQCGSISMATNAERFEELKRSASMAKVFDLPVHVVTPQEIKDLAHIVNVDDVVGGIHIPSDGYANAVDITQALAKGARTGGARIFENTKVTKIRHNGERVTGVDTDDGSIDADYVVICGGMWTRDLAASVGVAAPLHACEHYYVLFEGVEGIDSTLPVLRDYDYCGYYKYDAGKLLVGAFEPNARPWGMDGISEDFCFDEIAGSFEHFEPLLMDAMRRVPALEKAGIQKFFCGPESFTPDVRYHLGESAELKGCFVAAGLNSIGLQSAGGVGKVMADWIRDGIPPADLWTVDIRRNMPFQINRKYLRERVTESLGLLYATHYPFKQYETARGVRRSAIHDRLVAAGACHGEAFGWERPNWYGEPGSSPRYEYSYGRQNWFEANAAECKAVREAVGLFDQSSFAKFRLEGRDAMTVLNRVCANDVDVAPGRLVYTQWLNEKGGIEADLTVTRLSETAYLIVTGAETEVKDFNWLKRHIPDDAHAVLTNISSAMGVISIMGPRARDLLQSICPNDLSHEAFPFATSQEIELGYALVRASRITYVGELGWELYIPTEFMTGVYDEIVAAGAAFGLKHCGYHALNALRMEKAYRHWGHDITDEDTPLEAGLGFAVKMDKAGGFIGREALLRQKETGLKQRLVQFLLKSPEPMLYHNEPIWQGDRIAGYIRSGMYAHGLGGACGLGYITAPDDGVVGAIGADDFEIEIAGVRYPALASLKPLYDPSNARIKI
ncbi:GcvT family protein [Sphingorhabdus lacus]|uniref:FAD-dependent oxidoreductase n=1 Tax=Sphingorhabdus lacus TaxID=392610 RepID=A0A6I6L6G7_9SPHN|nr:FAD-dependent oxidoreductase [Sphingorhabdus lacus]QGY79556.1 FAD-dependent oxidoreductase [Sphingorhabdus lacus]